MRIDSGEFCWNKEDAKSTLSDINVSIKPGQLVAVVGTVGSGKSSLLGAILGEMEKINGTVGIKVHLTLYSTRWVSTENSP